MMPSVPPAAFDEPKFEVIFNSRKPKVSLGSHSCRLELPLPLLAGKTTEFCPLPGSVVRQENGLLMLENDDNLIGALVVPAPDRLEDPVCEAYESVLKACISRNHHLHRVWNYVPRINEAGHGLERYRQFNIGRWLAFEKSYGRDLRAFMPAASAVGIDGKAVVLFFIAGKTEPLYLENPSQVPAYHYPSDYGPCPPSFARAVLVPGKTEIVGYLSGTASIEGHRSVGEGDWHAQFRTTMHNIRIMMERMGMTDILKGPSAAAKAKIEVVDFRCYLRHEEMLPLIREWIAEEGIFDDSRIIYQKADICRHELDLEIEAVLIKKL